jgi:hypothetical protein
MPEEAVNAASLMNRSLRKHEALFMPANDLLIRKETDEDVEYVTLACEKAPRPGLAVMATCPRPTFPSGVASSPAEGIALLFDNLPSHVTTAFSRVRDGLRSAHHLAVEAEPQTLPAVTIGVQFY